ncbi:44846_t:CDS:1, partial [Gigaspora margarita]
MSKKPLKKCQEEALKEYKKLLKNTSREMLKELLEKSVQRNA